MALPAGLAMMSSGATGAGAGTSTALGGAAARGGVAGAGGGGMGLGDIMGMFGKKSNQIDTGLAQLADLSKRAGIQSLVETEGLFRAFGKQGGGINEAMRGSVGFDPIGAQAQSEAASTLDKRNEARDERINALLDKIGA